MSHAVPPGERVLAGLFFIGVGVVSWVLASRPIEDVTRFALPQSAALITPQMLRLMELARRPLAAAVCVLGVIVFVLGVVQAFD